ncbi:MAG: ParA family protein [Planctomycetota bacterium]|jgi:chromosome partitioning protein
MRVIAVFNHKGGVGKTTTVANLGAGLARANKRVLLLDCDPQANLTVHFGVDLEDPGKTLYDVLARDTPLEEAVRPADEDNLWILPSHLDLAGAELELATAMGRERIIKDALDTYLATHRDLDYVFFDCPPSIGLLTVNTLTATDEVFVPLQTEFLALRGVGKLLEVVNKVRRRLNPDLNITGILPTLSRTGTLLAREVQQEIETHFGDRVFKTRIRSNVRLAEAPSHGKSIFAYDPRSAGALDYAALAIEVDAMRVPHRRLASPEPTVDIDSIMAQLQAPPLEDPETASAPPAPSS